VLILSLVAACDAGALSPRDELAAARAHWQAAGIMNYDFDLRVSCFCIATTFGTVTVSVRDGRPPIVESTDSGTVVDTVYFQDYLTVDRMFALLGRVLSARPASFAATYDPGFGFPAQVSVDANAQVADDELGLHIVALRPAAIPLR
jgi:hypothetical protein